MTDRRGVSQVGTLNSGGFRAGSSATTRVPPKILRW